MNRHETLKEYLTALYRAEAVVTDNPSAPLYFNGSRSLTDYPIHLLDVELPIITCLRSIRQEEENQSSEELDIPAIRQALDEALRFTGEIDTALVATILDKVVVKKESTKDDIHLDIFLKLGSTYEAVYTPLKHTAGITSLRNITPKPPIRRI